MDQPINYNLDIGMRYSIRLYRRDRDHLAAIRHHLEIEPSGDGQLSDSAAIRWAMWYSYQMIRVMRPERFGDGQ